MLEPIVKTIEVSCSREEAFDVFVSEMPTWWPLDRFSMSVKGGTVAKTLRVESRSGGQIVEVSLDGTEHLWGTIREYRPPAFVSMDFHMGLPAESASLVEIRFAAIAADQTRVELTQSNWEAFGDLADMMRGGYGKGWAVIFEQRFKAACDSGA